MQPQQQWQPLKHYDQDHLARIALPVGGIGTGTISLGGRGNLRDWEIFNRPAKGFVPQGAERHTWPSLLLSFNHAGQRITRLLEGPLEDFEYEGAHGSPAPNHGLPRFRSASFDAGYPFGRVNLRDPELPVEASLTAFNPLIPADPDNSGLPVFILEVSLQNRSADEMEMSVCMNVPNFIGLSGKERANRNVYRSGEEIDGIMMMPGNVPRNHEAWGSLALVTTSVHNQRSWRTAWKRARWGASLLDFWDEFSTTGRLTERPAENAAAPMASLVVTATVPAHAQHTVTFLLTWHFPNRKTWTPKKTAQSCGCSDETCCDGSADIIGNYYTERFSDAWEVAQYVARNYAHLKEQSILFNNALVESDLPPALKEGALFNLSTLRTQTVFRTPDGYLFGFEGCHDQAGCCHGSCTHVWNYETATPFLFADLACGMREIEFRHATDDNGRMAFRVHLPLDRARDFARAAADGQMGCIVKACREWQLSGNTQWLRELWPKIRLALEFCWIEGGWDADRDGVMEGCQHNTMDVEYYGPNPQMQGWYLAALRAAETMAKAVGDEAFAETCHKLFENGSQWMDNHLFNGEYYIHQIRPIPQEKIAEGLRVGMTDGSEEPENQLGEGCLIDQLVGQYMAHICDLGYLHDPKKVEKTFHSILTYNRKQSFHDHFNCFRSYVLGDESAMLMAAYPDQRPANPFPYFTEVMTGFEWTAAAGMIYEGMKQEALERIKAIRRRYDGRRRNPYDEAECGHHYARAMAAWSCLLAWTGFHYSAVDGTMQFNMPGEPSTWFWSTGRAWGQVTIDPQSPEVRLMVMGGKLKLNRLRIRGMGIAECDGIIGAPTELSLVLSAE